MPLRDLLLAGFVFTMLPVCFARPWIGILMWTWIGMMNPQWLTFGFAYEMPWAMMTGVATLAGLVFARDRKPVPWNAQLVLMVLLLGYFAATTYTAWVPDAAYEKLKLVLKVVLMAIVGTTLIYSHHRIRWLLMVIVVSIGFYGVKGGLWAIATGGGNMVHGPDGGFIQGNNAIGLALVMVIPMMLALARNERRAWARRALVMSAAISAVAVVCTYSRGAMLGLAAIAPFLLFKSRSKIAAVLILVPVLTIAVMYAPEKVFDRAQTIATYQQDGSAMQRLAAWSAGWNVAVERPLTGAGFDFYFVSDPHRWLAYVGPSYRSYLSNSCAAHSIYFQVLGEHGFVALALYLALLLSTLRSCSRLAKQAAADPALAWVGHYASAIRVGMIGYMVTGAFLSFANFDLAWVYYTFTAILARELAMQAAAGPRVGAGKGARAVRMPAAGGGKLRPATATGG